MVPVDSKRAGKKSPPPEINGSESRERNTRQKTVVRNIFLQVERPLGAQEVLELSQALLPGLGIATVYRVIKQLVEAGELVPVPIPGQEHLRYERSGLKHHHHFHCLQCDRVYPVGGCVGSLSSLVPPGFVLQGHTIIFSGLCHSCTPEKQ